VIASPSNETDTGRAILAKDPDSSGSLGMAISEAVEDAAKRSDTNYSLGSVLNHVCLHQTVIGQECIDQMKKIGAVPDIVIACCGGGSNFAGLAFPFVPMKMEGKKDIRLIAVEPKSCPTLTEGRYEYDLGDNAGFTPLMMMYTLGHDFMPPPIHAGGLRYHGDSPLVSLLVHEGICEATAYTQLEVFESAMLFAQTEGIIPAPESAHAIRCAVDEAKKCTATGEEKVILFGLSGHGYFDLTAYDMYLTGQLT
jgi:pyridoxal-phosphate dependent TrpB-like enzyme